MSLIALTRPVSASLVDCELTHLDRESIDVDRARQQHAEYERALEVLGAQVIQLPAADTLPDAVFIEDTALVLDEVAVITRPGAVTRRGEIAGVAETLAHYRELKTINAPGTIDGGDILQLGKDIYVGISSRTNEEGIQQLHNFVSPFGYRVTALTVKGCLHLKSAVTQVGEKLLLYNPEWIVAESFPGFGTVAVDPTEPGAANALKINEAVIYASHYPLTAERLVQIGIPLCLVPASELAKAEGAVTCCSLIIR